LLDRFEPDKGYASAHGPQPEPHAASEGNSDAPEP
jgi:hypothetical protein